jgi:hypothetical protein
MFAALRPRFEEARFWVYNCNPDSNLTVFDYLPYDAAIAAAQADMPKRIRTEGWYVKEAKK